MKNQKDPGNQGNRHGKKQSRTEKQSVSARTPDRDERKEEGTKMPERETRTPSTGDRNKGR